MEKSKTEKVAPLLILVAVGAVITLFFISYFIISSRKVSESVAESSVTMPTETTESATPGIPAGRTKEKLDAALEAIDEAVNTIDSDINAIEEAASQSDDAPEL